MPQLGRKARHGPSSTGGPDCEDAYERRRAADCNEKNFAKRPETVAKSQIENQTAQS